MKKILAAFLAMGLMACGGGGGGTATPIDPGLTVTGPYNTIFGTPCAGSEPTPGCTFIGGGRINVSMDPNFNRNGNGVGDMWYVVFSVNQSDSVDHITANVYDQNGVFQYAAAPETFAGYLGNGVFGVGAWQGGEGGGFNGIFESVGNGMYFLGKNGVLYSANYPNQSGCLGESGPCNPNGAYGQAINSQDASHAWDMSLNPAGRPRPARSRARPCSGP